MLFEEVRHVYHMRLLGHVFQDRHSLCHGRRHHNIDGRAYAYYVKINMFSDQPVCLCHDLAMLDLHIRAHCAKSFDMLIDRTASDITSARKRNVCSLILAKQRSQKIIGSTDLFDIIVFNRNIMDILSIDLHRMSVYTVNHCADALDRIQ